MTWEQEGQIGRSRTAGKGPVGEARKKREGKIGPWGKPVGGGGWFTRDVWRGGRVSSFLWLPEDGRTERG